MSGLLRPMAKFLQSEVLRGQFLLPMVSHCFFYVSIALFVSPLPTELVIDENLLRLSNDVALVERKKPQDSEGAKEIIPKYKVSIILSLSFRFIQVHGGRSSSPEERLESGFYAPS